MQAPIDNGADKDFIEAPEMFPGWWVIRLLKLLSTSFMVKAM